MPKKFVTNLTTEELREIHDREGMTLIKMCQIVGCKSAITLRRILRSRGIDTYKNDKVAFQKRGGRTDAEFREYLQEEYIEKRRSMSSIAHELNVSWVIISRYLDKYGIYKRSKGEQQSGEGGVNWSGGRNVRKSGYIEVYMPNHPRANVRNYVYEHQLVAEKKLGRYLKDGEVVHHIDQNKSNNSEDNLIVLTNGDHAKLHRMLKNGIDYRDAIKMVEVITC